MTFQIVLPFFIVGHFFRPEPCMQCRRIPDRLNVGYPFLKIEGDSVFIRYAGQCTCGARQTIRFRLPLLFFGYILARFVILDAERKARRSKAEMRVTPKPCDFVAQFALELQGLIARQKETKASELTDADRFALPMTDDDFSEFMRRMGFDEAGEKTEE